MNIIHRISISAGADEVKNLRQMGVNVAEGFASFTISERDDYFSDIINYLSGVESVDIIETKFSKKEIVSAACNQIFGMRHLSYPQPEDGYLKTTYDLSDYCPSCGSGKRQKAPFMLSDIKHKSREVFQINWIYDEYFAGVELWDSSLRDLGFGAEPTLDVRTGKERSDLVQLVYPDLIHVHVDVSGLDFCVCPVCDRKKYVPSTRGFAPPPSEIPGLFFKSIEEFGSGALASRAVMVSAEFFRAYESRELTGIAFSPCRP